ncbi:hypothetical protein HETIRDRAFT_239856, partial [Heterobasidion irregulare TC 32-1]
FEFMKRKRWADLLISELSEAIILVLSASCKVLFCGHAVQELLGWKDEELVDGDLIELMNANDRDSFRGMFAQAIAARGDLLTYARLKCKPEYYGAAEYHAPQKEVLFEIMGYPHVGPDDECSCFFAMAKPYPSRNIAMLNTFLELKVENARLRERLQALRARSQELGATQAAAAAASRASIPFESGSMSSQLAVHLGLDAAQPFSSDYPYYSVASHTYGGPSHAPAGMGMGMGAGPSAGTGAGAGANSAGAGAGAGAPGPEDDTDESRRKKAKRVYTTDQHVCVTCGRTDSPEWRKGPHGPKTLCNACGLRWAKKVRKFEEANEAGGG